MLYYEVERAHKLGGRDARDVRDVVGKLAAINKAEKKQEEAQQLKKMKSAEFIANTGKKLTSLENKIKERGKQLDSAIRKSQRSAAKYAMIKIDQALDEENTNFEEDWSAEPVISQSVPTTPSVTAVSQLSKPVANTSKTANLKRKSSDGEGI